MLLNNEWVNDEIKEENKNYLEAWKWTHKPMGHRKGSPERKVHSKTELPKEEIKISTKQPNTTSTRTRGTTINNAQRD